MANGQTCKIMVDSINKLWEAGKFNEALAIQLDSLCLREVGDQDSLYADALAIRGFAVMAKGKAKAALPFFNRAMRIVLRTRGLFDQSTGALFSARGLALVQSGFPEQALASLDTSLLIKNHLRDTSSNLGTAYATRGQILLLSGRYAEAKSDLLLSIQNARANKLDTSGFFYLVRINTLGLVLTYLGENAEATFYLQEAVRISDVLMGPQDITSITCLSALGQNYTGLGQYDKALATYDKALFYAEKYHPDHTTTNMIRSNRGVVLLEKGRYYEALADLLQAKAIEDEHHRLNPADYATLINNIGNIYLKANDFANALPYLTEARERMASALGRDNPRYALLNGNLSACHFMLGNDAMAKALANESFSIVESFGPNFPDFEIYLSNTTLANVVEESMLESLARAMEISREKFGEKSQKYGRYLTHYATFLSNLDREKEGLPYLKKAEKILQADDKNRTIEYHDVLRNLATAYENLGKTKLSLKYYQKALALAETITGKHNSSYAYLLQGAAGIEERQGKIRAAFNHYMAADTIYQLVTRKNFAVLPDAGREAYLADIRPQLDHWHSFAWRNAANIPEIPGLLYDDQLSEKGQLLHSARSVMASLRGDSTLSHKMTQWLGLRQTVDAQRQHLTGSDKKAQYSSFQLDSLAREADLLESYLAQHSQAFASAARPFAWRDVQAALLPDEVAVEFFHFKYNKPDAPTDSTVYGALVLKPGERSPLFVPLLEEKQLASAISKSSLSHGEWLGKLYPSKSPDTSALYHLVWAPIAPHCKGAQKIWYSPSGLLHKISMPAIAIANGERLLNRFDLQQVGSSREIVASSRFQESHPRTALIYTCVSYPTDTSKMQRRTRECYGPDGKLVYRDAEDRNPDPLPYSLPEADTVALQLLAVGTKVTVKIGYEPLEDDARQELSAGDSPDFLMFSTHGFSWDTLPLAFKGRFPPRNPMYSSGLLLAGSESAWLGRSGSPNFQDGILTAREISELNLQNTRLALLSACESGLGDAGSSEGVYGLQRGFKLAGAHQVLATLWKIPDSPETKEFVGQFCQRWLATGNARKALRETQLDFHDKGKSVRVWGAWVLI